MNKPAPWPSNVSRVKGKEHGNLRAGGRDPQGNGWAMSLDRQRARAIVSAAAAQVEDPNTADWLRVDREGTWEKTAAELIESTAEKAASLNMTAAEVDTAIAAYTALTAQVAHLKKKRAK